MNNSTHRDSLTISEITFQYYVEKRKNIEEKIYNLIPKLMMVTEKSEMFFIDFHEELKKIYEIDLLQKDLQVLNKKIEKLKEVGKSLGIKKFNSLREELEKRIKNTDNSNETKN